MSTPATNPFRSHTCYVCGRQKGEGNHWWLLSIVEAIIPGTEGLGNVTVTPYLVLNHWHKLLALENSRYPACGSKDAQILIERFLSTGTFDGPGVAGNPPEPKGDV